MIVNIKLLTSKGIFITKAIINQNSVQRLGLRFCKEAIQEMSLCCADGILIKLKQNIMKQIEDYEYYIVYILLSLAIIFM